MFFASNGWCSLRLLQLKTAGQTPHQKVTKLALNNPALIWISSDDDFSSSPLHQIPPYLFLFILIVVLVLSIDGWIRCQVILLIKKKKN